MEESIFIVEQGVCATHAAEERAQSIRLTAGTLGAGGVAYIASQLPPDRSNLRLVGYGLAAACAWWNLSIFNAVRKIRGA